MNANSGPHFDWVESSVVENFDADFAKTFCKHEKESDLQMMRFCGGDLPDGNYMKSLTRQVSDADELTSLAKLPDTCQVFSIGQRNSYSRLNITRQLFVELTKAYMIFPRIWDFVLPFSFKTRESDIGHAPFRFRQSQQIFLGDASLGNFECAYGFRYVVQNHRTEALKNNPNYDPWSVRQCAIYQQYNSKNSRTVFALISPSNIVKSQLQEAVQKRVESRLSLNPFDLHRIIVATLFENWRLYIRSLERLLKHQSDRVILAQVRNESENLSPLTDFNLNFIDRQRLKMIEDKILDLTIIFESLIHTVSQLQAQCQSHCMMQNCSNCTCPMIVWELEELKHEGAVNVKKVEILYKRAQGTAQLLSNLLDYENAQIAHLNGKSLFGLAAESKDENSKMRLLTERSTRDAAAVKILTVITLIYLPVTVVASIFSSQLIHVDENGHISVISESWWFAVTAVPLTAITFVVWKCWLWCNIKRQKLKDEACILPQLDDEHGIRPHQFNFRRMSSLGWKPG